MRPTASSASQCAWINVSLKFAVASLQLVAYNFRRHEPVMDDARVIELCLQLINFIDTIGLIGPTSSASFIFGELPSMDDNRRQSDSSGN